MIRSRNHVEVDQAGGRAGNRWVVVDERRGDVLTLSQDLTAGRMSASASMALFREAAHSILRDDYSPGRTA